MHSVPILHTNMNVIGNLLALLFVVYSVSCFIRIENYKDSVYIQKGTNNTFGPADDTTFVDRNSYAMFTVSKDLSVDVGNTGSKSGHVVTFYKHDSNLNPVGAVAFLFTDKSYFDVIRRTLMQV